MHYANPPSPRLNPFAGSDIDDTLERFVRQKDSAYSWEIQHTTKDATGTFFEIALVSQRWQNLLWKHRLLFFSPERVLFPDSVLLVLRIGHGMGGEMEALKAAASATNTACAFLYDIPNQPLFDGKEEEELLAFTFSQYLKTGDVTWPLLFPMTKSVVRAMDTLQTMGREKRLPPLRRFIVAGHSKRGHTSWLTAAVDRRVSGIIPVAIDTLNAPAQIQHHRQVRQGLSRSAATFTETINQTKTPRGRKLIQLVDPYSYRTRLALPKLLVMATNDDYFPVDALNLYWDGLPGPKWIRYLPNTSHPGADSHPGVNATAFAFVRAVAAAKLLPALRWSFQSSNGDITARIAGAEITAARLWVASSPVADFSAASWEARSMSILPVPRDARPGETTYVARVETPPSGYVAAFAEIECRQIIPGVKEREPFVLSSQVYISGKT